MTERSMDGEAWQESIPHLPRSPSQVKADDGAFSSKRHTCLTSWSSLSAKNGVKTDSLNFTQRKGDGLQRYSRKSTFTVLLVKSYWEKHLDSRACTIRCCGRDEVFTSSECSNYHPLGWLTTHIPVHRTCSVTPKDLWLFFFFLLWEPCNLIITDQEVDFKEKAKNISSLLAFYTALL